MKKKQHGRVERCKPRTRRDYEDDEVPENDDEVQDDADTDDEDETEDEDEDEDDQDENLEDEDSETEELDDEAEDDDQDDTHKQRQPVPAGDFILSGFRNGPEHKQPGIFTPDWAIRIVGSKAELLVLAQFAYWFGVSPTDSDRGSLRARQADDGYYYVSKTCGEFAKEIGMSKDATRGAIRSLKESKILIAADDGSGRNIISYRLNSSQICNALKRALATDRDSEEIVDER